MSVSESVNIEVLRERFPSEVVNPYGEVLVVPSRLFQRGWEAELERQGFKVYANNYNGEAAFFVRLSKPKNAPPSGTGTVATIEKTPAKTHKKFWSREEEEKLKKMVESGMSNPAIARELGRTRISVMGKVQRMGLTHQRFGPTTPDTRISETNPVTAPPTDEIIIDEDMVKEFLSACSLLYPSHRRACAFLLREASNKILEGGNSK